MKNKLSDSSYLSNDDSNFYPRSLTLLANIMELIDERRFSQAQVAFALGISKPHVSYYVKNAIRIGYIKELFRDKIRVLELTQEGKIFLDQYKYNKQSSSISQNRLPVAVLKIFALKHECTSSLASH